MNDGAIMSDEALHVLSDIAERLEALEKRMDEYMPTRKEPKTYAERILKRERERENGLPDELKQVVDAVISSPAFVKYVNDRQFAAVEPKETAHVVSDFGYDIDEFKDALGGKIRRDKDGKRSFVTRVEGNKIKRLIQIYM